MSVALHRLSMQSSSRYFQRAEWLDEQNEVQRQVTRWSNHHTAFPNVRSPSCTPSPRCPRWYMSTPPRASSTRPERLSQSHRQTSIFVWYHPVQTYRSHRSINAATQGKDDQVRSKSSNDFHQYGWLVDECRADGIHHDGFEK